MPRGRLDSADKTRESGRNRAKPRGGSKEFEITGNPNWPLIRISRLDPGGASPGDYHLKSLYKAVLLIHAFLFPIDLQASQKTVSKLKLSHATHLALRFLPSYVYSYHSALSDRHLAVPVPKRKINNKSGTSRKRKDGMAQG